MEPLNGWSVIHRDSGSSPPFRFVSFHSGSPQKTRMIKDIGLNKKKKMIRLDRSTIKRPTQQGRNIKKWQYTTKRNGSFQP